MAASLWGIKLLKWEERFFNSVVSDKPTEEEKCISILKARGFLIECSRLDNSCYVSDNSCPGDKKYLEEILKGSAGDCQFGEIKNSTIYINEDAEAWELFRILFIDIDLSIIDATSCSSNDTWSSFRNRIHGFKFPVKLMEPYVARYIKAVSACGCNTESCCDGNHVEKHRNKRMVVGVGYPASRFWHNLICENITDKLFPLPWTGDHTKIVLNNVDRAEIYYTLNCAADWLYKNRFELQEIKRKSLHRITKDYYRRHNLPEIEKRVEEYAVPLMTALFQEKEEEDVRV